MWGCQSVTWESSPPSHCHTRLSLFVLPEENLGEQISWGRRIILPLLPQGFHSPGNCNRSHVSFSTASAGSGGIRSTLKGQLRQTLWVVRITRRDTEDIRGSDVNSSGCQVSRISPAQRARWLAEKSPTTLSKKRSQEFRLLIIRIRKGGNKSKLFIYVLKYRVNILWKYQNVLRINQRSILSQWILTLCINWI